MKLYKLTKRDGTTMNNTQWDVGITHRLGECKQPELCSRDVLHAYKNINLAFLLNPIHANIHNPKLFEVEGDICVEDYGKVGCFSLDVTRELEIPVWVNSSREKKVRVMFAVLCAESVLHVWNTYNAPDTRVVNAIEAAREYLRARDAYAARAAQAAARAAHTAAHAAHAVAHAAAHAAHAAAYAAQAAAYAAQAAARAAQAAARADAIDFCRLADEAARFIESQ